MPIARSRTFRSGNSEALRLPKDVAFGLDRMIAAQALIHRATLVTLNAGDFADVVGLQLIAW